MTASPLARASDDRLILTDLDDTCLNFGDRFQAYVEARGLRTTGRLRDLWRIEDLLGIPTEAVIPHLEAFTADPAIRHEPEPCAATVFPLLRKAGYRFIGISACGTDPGYHARRVENLVDAFGFAFDELVCVPFAGGKHEILARYPRAVWVEDNLAHAEAGAALGHRTFLIDRPYNRAVYDPDAFQRDADALPIVRVDTWREIQGALQPECLPDLVRMAYSHGVVLDAGEIRLDGRDVLRIKWIERAYGPPGSGRVVLKALCAYADARRLAIRGNVMDSEPALIALYEAVGYRVVDPDDDEGALMIREPR